MTKISSKSAYPKKVPIVDDYFVGTDSENFGKTVNFGFEATAGLINKLNGTPILNYVFSTTPYVDTEVLVEGRFLSFETELETSLLTKLYVNKFNNSGDNLGEFYLFLKDNATDFYLKLRNSNNQNNSVYFNIASVQNFPDYFIFNIAVFKENEFLPLLENLNVYFFDFELKATSAGGSDPLKLDKSTYTGNAQDLDNRIDALENVSLPDAILKLGDVVVAGNTATIDANDFQWRLNQVDYLVTPAYSTTISNATAGYYRSDLIVGDNTGNYSLVQGVEDNLAAPEPLVPVGKIKLALIPIFGSTIGVPPLLPNYDDKFLKRYKTTYKTSQANFNISPSEDDYNVIFIGATNSSINIFDNGTSGKFIKNGAIYPFKNMGTGIITVWSDTNVTLNAPNGVVLNPTQQCYLIKDDYNEWTLINPVSSFSGETAASIKVKYESNSDTNAFTDTLKAKLDSITAIFTTALKTAYDGAVTWIATNGANVISAYTWVTTNGTNLLNHLSNTSNPHSITKAQVGLGNVPNISFSGSNTGDQIIPTTLPASDVYAWAKAPTKPTYTNAEVGAPSGSGTSTGTNTGDQDLSGKQDALVSGTNIKTKGGISLLGSGDIPNSAKITTTVSITNTTTTVAGDVQEGKIVKIDNGVNVINYTVNGALNASFIKMGTGAITFVQGSGRTLTGANGTLVLNGAVNSTASIVSDGTVDIVYINNLS